MRPERGGPRRDLRDLTPGQEEYLRYGRMQLLKPPDPIPFASEDEARQAWRIHGPRILQEWADPGKEPRGLTLFGEP